MQTLDAGLCEHCRYGKIVRTDRGGVFLLCRLHETDPRFAKYPRLPVLRCSGYVKKTADP